MNDEACMRTWITYQRAWGPVDDRARRDLLTQSVADDIVYTDPMTQTVGVTALAERIEAAQRQYPGSRFDTERFLEHHRQGLFHWTMFDGTNAVFATGSSFARFGDDGRLVQATGFFAVPDAR